MLAAGVVLGAGATTAVLSAPNGIRPSQAIASEQFSRDCPPPSADRPRAVGVGARSLEGQTVTVAGVWTDREGKNFKAVLRRFERSTGARVRYVFDTRDIAQTITARLVHDCPPDIAMLPQPGLLTELAEDSLAPLDDIAGDLLDNNYSPAWRRMAEVDGKSYGVWFKAANKSNFWYSRRALDSAGLKPPRTWRQLQAAAERLSSVAGPAPFAIAGQDGWTLTDWFENVYLRVAGPTRYTELARHQIPCTHPTVKRTLRTLNEIFSRRQWFDGGVTGALNTSHKESVADVFGPSPTAAMVLEGDFVLNELAPTERRDVGAMRFPSIGNSGPAVVVGGDMAVLFRKSENKWAARMLMRFLASPTAARSWVRAGGFISPNKRLDRHTYPDPDHPAAGPRAHPHANRALRPVGPPAAGLRRQGRPGHVANDAQVPEAPNAPGCRRRRASGRRPRGRDMREREQRSVLTGMSCLGGRVRRSL